MEIKNKLVCEPVKIKGDSAKIKFRLANINYDEIYNRTMGEIRTKIIDIDYDEIWYRYKNESETFKYLDGIQKEEGNAEIALYKWILYLAYGGECYNYTCNDKTFEEAVRRIYEAVYRHRFLKTSMVDNLSCDSGYSDVNSLVNAINSGKQKWKQIGSSLFIENLRDNNEVHYQVNF